VLCTISTQLFAEHQVTTGSHPSYRHEEIASPNTRITLLTGGLLVRIQPEEPILTDVVDSSKITAPFCRRLSVEKQAQSKSEIRRNIRSKTGGLITR
jgi:hypothetical protein